MARTDTPTVGLLSNLNSGNLQIEQPKISAGRTTMTKSLHKGLIRMMKGGDLWLLNLGLDDWTGCLIEMRSEFKNRSFSPLAQFRIGMNMPD
jgi:hypothetical protein